MSEMKRLDEAIHNSEEGGWVTPEDVATGYCEGWVSTITFDVSGHPVGVQTTKRRKKTYTYTLELKTPWWPRHLADKLLMLPLFAGELLSVTDCQRDDHSASGYKNGKTYIVGQDGECDALDVIMSHLASLLSSSEVEVVRDFIGREILEKR